MNKMIDALNAQQNIALFAHIVPDGDALGSLFGFAHILKKMGKTVTVYVAGNVPKRLQFIADLYGDTYYTDVPPEDTVHEVCLALDCGDFERLGRYKPLYEKATITFNIDHHISNPKYATHNLVMPKASSTGEILYLLCEQAGFEWDEKAASLLYGSIASDTGCFCHSNTSPDTHRYAARLMEYGADFALFNRKLFQTESKTALKARAYIIDVMQQAFDGKVTYALVDDEALFGMGATKEDTEGLIDVLRSVDGTEVAFLLKTYEDSVKVSMRTATYVDAAKLLGALGGGGHVRAAGCTLHVPMEEAKNIVLNALEEWI